MGIDEVHGYLDGFRPELLSGMDPNFQWLPLAILASMIVLIIYTAALMVARGFSIQGLERTSKAEIMNAVATMLIAIFIIGLLGEAESIAVHAFLCGAGPCPTFSCGGKSIQVDELGGSLGLLKCRLSEKAHDFSNLQVEVTKAAAVPLNLLNTYIALIGIPIFQGNYIGAWFKEAEQYRLINMTLTNLLIGINTLIVVITYIERNMLSFWLPLGIILRAFFFTRGVGAFLISASICLFFVFPLVYLLIDPGYVKPTFKAPESGLPAQEPLCYPTFTGMIQNVKGASGGISAGAGAISLDQLRSDISVIYTAVILQPFIAFAITMVLLRFLVYVLGGEARDIMRAVAKVV